MRNTVIYHSLSDDQIFCLAKYYDFIASRNKMSPTRVIKQMIMDGLTTELIPRICSQMESVAVRFTLDNSFAPNWGEYELNTYSIKSFRRDLENGLVLDLS